MAHRVDPWRDDLLRSRPASTLAVHQPLGHAVLRYAALRKLLCSVAAMRRQGILPAVPATLRGARNQFDEGRGTRAGGTQGAHKLPRQLLLGDRTIEDWLRAAGAEELIILNLLGAEATATVLLAAWNRADSLWEAKGLAEAFRAAAAAVVAWPASGDTPVALFKAMWARFHLDAGQALGAAIAHCGAGDERLPPLHAYRQAHQGPHAGWEDEPGSVREMLATPFR